jgi:hypothetical protein
VLNLNMACAGDLSHVLPTPDHDADA